MSVPSAGSHSCVVNPRLKDAQKGSLTLGGKYGRMFPDLPALEADEDSTIGLGRAASHMDGTLPIIESTLENPRIPAGFAILGQFVALTRPSLAGGRCFLGLSPGRLRWPELLRFAEAA